MKTERVALYARVSTLNHGQDPEVQLRELRAYCERRGFEIVDEYVDTGISGSQERRPALDRLNHRLPKATRGRRCGLPLRQIRKKPPAVGQRAGGVSVAGDRLHLDS